MKIEKPENSNYAAVVVKLKAIVPLDNCDNVVGTPIFGFQAIISKDYKVGDMGIVFTVETQLSDDFCRFNNLYRHADLNKDKDQKGYIEDNRRVRAVKFRGQTSNCFFMPLDSLKWTGAKIAELKEGDEFDILNGKEVCKKYVIKRNTPRNQAHLEKKKSRVDAKHMPEHFDTLNFFKFLEKIDPESEVTVTQKIHGTSIRVGHTIVKRKIGIGSKVARFLGVKIQETEHDYIYGSRKVIKDANNPDQMHYYEMDIWTDQGKKLQGLLPENYLVFGELIGWTADGKEIQKNYSYGIQHGVSELFIYRIAIVSPSGHLTDLSWDQIKDFCKKNALQHVPELWKGKVSEFPVKDFLDTRYFDDKGHRNALWLGENKDIVDEGVCVRIEGTQPQIFKAKSPKFLEHETKILDTGEEDLESAQVESNDITNS